MQNLIKGGRSLNFMGDYSLYELYTLQVYLIFRLWAGIMKGLLLDCRRVNTYTVQSKGRHLNTIPMGGGGRTDQSESAACHLSTLPTHSHIPFTWHSGTEVVTFLERLRDSYCIQNIISVRRVVVTKILLQFQISIDQMC
jgi:hypothetical protein